MPAENLNESFLRGFRSHLRFAAVQVSFIIMRTKNWVEMNEITSLCCSCMVAINAGTHRKPTITNIPTEIFPGQKAGETRGHVISKYTTLIGATGETISS